MTGTADFWNSLNTLSGSIVSVAHESVQLFHFSGLLKSLALITTHRDLWVHRISQTIKPVFCLSDVADNTVQTTAQLISHPKVIDFLDTLPTPVRILMFKPDAKTTNFLFNQGYEVIGTEPSLARKLESKLLFPSLAIRAGLQIPETVELQVPELSEANRGLPEFDFPFVCQFAKSFSGNRTFFIENSADWSLICQTFSNRRCRISRYMAGETWTANSCITHSGQIFVSDPFKQITRHISGPDNQLPTRIGSRGNQWGKFPGIIREQVSDAMKRLGQTLFNEGYRGFWGADLLIDSNQNLFAIEINPRLTASACVLSNMEHSAGCVPLAALHVGVFAGIEIPEQLPICSYPEGGQRIHREKTSQNQWVYQLVPGVYQLDSNGIKAVDSESSLWDLRENEFALWCPTEDDKSDSLRRIIYRHQLPTIF